MAEQRVAATVTARDGVSRSRRSALLNSDSVFRGITCLAALAVLAVAALTVVTLFVNSRDAFSAYGWSFLSSDVWDPNIKLVFGAQSYIFGTVVTAVVALIMAGVVGIGIALLLVEVPLPGWFRTPVAFLVELLAAIPSVVFGVWGIFVLIPIMQRQVDPFLVSTFGRLPFFPVDAGGGHSILTASLVIGAMIVPTVAAISRDVIRVVPSSQREAMLALGATRWEMIWRVVLPYARPGIIGALILAMGRAVGETIAATMIIGNSNYIGPNLLHSGDTLASKIAANLGEAGGNELAALFELGLILMVVSVILNVLARLLVWTVSHGSAQVA